MTTATATRPRKTRPTVADKAEMLLANAATWLRCRDRHTGKLVAYGVPSLTEAGKYYLTNGKGCECQAAQAGRECCHRAAAALYITERRTEAAQAATYAAALLADDAANFVIWLDAVAAAERAGQVAADTDALYGPEPAELGVAA